jgi:hypothetical protein
VIDFGGKSLSKSNGLGGAEEMISLISGGGNSDDRFKLLDFRRVTFPSDALTIGVLRAQHSELFDKGFAEDNDRAQPKFFIASRNAGHSEDVVGNMLFIERLIATAAFAKAQGIPPPEADIEGYKDELATMYLRYSLAQGAHHAAELIRDIERQGAALVNDKQL